MSDSDKTPIARWRARMGLSQRAAAEALGMSLNALQDRERGTSRKSGDPLPDVLMLRLAAAAREAGIDPIE